jgi:hypothetical protein
VRRDLEAGASNVAPDEDEDAFAFGGDFSAPDGRVVRLSPVRRKPPKIEAQRECGRAPMPGARPCNSRVINYMGAARQVGRICRLLPTFRAFSGGV